MENVERPWQGTLLGVINAITLITLMGLLIFLLAGPHFLSGIVPQLSAMMSTFGLMLLAPLGAFVFLAYYVTRGVFRGQKWSVVFLTILYGLSVASAVTSLPQSAVSMIISALLLWMGIVCWKHPFYNPKQNAVSQPEENSTPYEPGS
ncbi:MAG: hypothetical protein COB85_07555 [Bacteroidetes bacterium]|nr:MAG: hypothetical protein COB85_07555 [Bacteroidota bacterium]